VLSNRPQGGFMTREPSTEAFVASDNFRNDDGFGFFFQPIGAPKLAMPVGRAARIIIECIRAGSRRDKPRTLN
jgi:hypothetical protein